MDIDSYVGKIVEHSLSETSSKAVAPSQTQPGSKVSFPIPVQLYGTSNGALQDRLREARRRRLRSKHDAKAGISEASRRIAPVSDYRVLGAADGQKGEPAPDSVNSANARLIGQMSQVELEDSVQSAIEMLPYDLLDRIREARRLNSPSSGSVSDAIGSQEAAPGRQITPMKSVEERAKELAADPSKIETEEDLAAAASTLDAEHRQRLAWTGLGQVGDTSEPSPAGEHRDPTSKAAGEAPAPKSGGIGSFSGHGDALRRALEARLGKPIGMERLGAEHALEGKVLEPGAAPASLLPDDDGARYDLEGNHVKRGASRLDETSKPAAGAHRGPGAEALFHHGNVGASEAEELAESSGSRAAADSPVVVPGYTLTDLVTLCRSRVAGQRVAALRCIAKVLRRRREEVVDRMVVDASRSSEDARKHIPAEGGALHVIRPARLPRMLLVAIRVATSEDNLAALAAGFSAAAALVGTDDAYARLPDGSAVESGKSEASHAEPSALDSFGDRFYSECLSGRGPVLVPSLRARYMFPRGYMNGALLEHSMPTRSTETDLGASLRHWPVPYVGLRPNRRIQLEAGLLEDDPSEIGRPRKAAQTPALTTSDRAWQALTDDWEAASASSLDFEDRFDTIGATGDTAANASDSASSQVFDSQAEEGTAALRDPLASWAAAGYVEHLAAVLHPKGAGAALAESNPSGLADAIRVVVSLARRSLSIAAAVAGVQTRVSKRAGDKRVMKSLLESIVYLTLQGSAGASSASAASAMDSPRVQAIRLLRVVCASGQTLARTCAARWLLGAAKRPILEWTGGDRSYEVRAAACESFALWYLCLGYGLDVTTWVDMGRSIRGRCKAAFEAGGSDAITACMAWKVAAAVAEVAVREVEASRGRRNKRDAKTAAGGGMVEIDSDDEDDEDERGVELEKLEKLEGLETRNGARAHVDDAEPGRGLGGMSGAAARLAGAVVPVLRDSVRQLLRLVLNDTRGRVSDDDVLKATSLLSVLASHLKALDIQGPTAADSSMPFAPGDSKSGAVPFAWPATQVAASTANKSAVAQSAFADVLGALAQSRLLAACCSPKASGISSVLAQDLVSTLAGATQRCVRADPSLERSDSGVLRVLRACADLLSRPCAEASAIHRVLPWMPSYAAVLQRNRVQLTWAATKLWLSLSVASSQPQMRDLMAASAHQALRLCIPGDEGYATALVAQGVLLPSGLAAQLLKEGSFPADAVEMISLATCRDLLYVTLPLIGSSGARTRASVQLARRGCSDIATFRSPWPRRAARPLIEHWATDTVIVPDYRSNTRGLPMPGSWHLWAVRRAAEHTMVARRVALGSGQPEHMHGPHRNPVAIIGATAVLHKVRSVMGLEDGSAECRGTAWHAFRCCESDPTVLRMPQLDGALSNMLLQGFGKDGLGDALHGGTGGKEQAMFAVGAACKAVAAMGESAPGLCHLSLFLALCDDSPFSLQALALAELRRSNAILSLSFASACRGLAVAAKYYVWQACLQLHGAADRHPGHRDVDNANSVGKQVVSMLAEEKVPRADPGVEAEHIEGGVQNSLAYFRLVYQASNYLKRTLGTGGIGRTPSESDAGGEDGAADSVAETLDSRLRSGIEIPFGAAAVLRKLRDGQVSETLTDVLLWCDGRVPVASASTDARLSGRAPLELEALITRIRAL